MSINGREIRVNKLLHKMNIHLWGDKDKVLLLKAILYETIYADYPHTSFIRTIERVTGFSWEQISDMFRGIK
jgi:hypothetical protein